MISGSSVSFLDSCCSRALEEHNGPTYEVFNKQLPDCDSTGQFVETCESESTPQGVSWKYENKQNKRHQSSRLENMIRKLIDSNGYRGKQLASDNK